jgi:hypothetical protein
MTILVDDFTGADNTLVSSRPGWIAFGWADWLFLDGTGAVKDSGAGDAKWVMTDTGSPAHYVEFVLGAGFPGSVDVGVLVANNGSTRYQGIGLQWASGGGLAVISHRSALGGNTSVIDTIAGTFVAGDTIFFSWDPVVGNIQVKQNGTLIYNWTKNTENEYLVQGLVGQFAGLVAGYNGRTPTSDIFRSWVSDAAGGDITKPVLTSPTASAASSTAASGGVSTTEAGPSWAVVTNSATKPTPTQVKLGQDHTGSPALASDVALLAVGANASAFTFDGLTAGTSGLRMHVTQDDEADPPNTADVVTSDAFSTPAAPVRCTLTLTVDGSGPAANLTGLSWCWWDSAAPNLALAPKASGTGATTNASGVFDVALPTSTLAVGQTGRLLVYSGNGVAGDVSNKAFCGPVVVS